MHERIVTFAALMTLAGCATTSATDLHATGDDPLTQLPLTLEVTSTTVEAEGAMPEETVFDGFGCTGENVSPQLSWSPGPAGTRSYLVMLYDPDAPTGVGFHHWWLANLPATTRSLPEGFEIGRAHV